MLTGFVVLLMTTELTLSRKRTENLLVKRGNRWQSLPSVTRDACTLTLEDTQSQVHAACGAQQKAELK